LLRAPLKVLALRALPLEVSPLPAVQRQVLAVASAKGSAAASQAQV
jgi:hypothetical protein